MGSPRIADGGARAMPKTGTELLCSSAAVRIDLTWEAKASRPTAGGRLWGSAESDREREAGQGAS